MTQIDIIFIVKFGIFYYKTKIQIAFYLTPQLDSHLFIPNWEGNNKWTNEWNGMDIGWREYLGAGPNSLLPFISSFHSLPVYSMYRISGFEYSFAFIQINLDFSADQKPWNFSFKP